MKVPTSTLALLQLSAAALAQFSPETWDYNLTQICVPGFESDGEMLRDAPCYRAPDAAYKCIFGGEINIEKTPEAKPVSLKEQQECVCNSDMWEMYKACANCFKLHGGLEGRDYVKDEFYDDASSKFCNAKPTQKIENFLMKYMSTETVTTAKTSHSNVLGTQTAVSLYYTAAAAVTGDSPAGATGGAKPTATGTDAAGDSTGTGTGAAATSTGAAPTLMPDTGLLAPAAGALLAIGLL